MRVRRAVWGVAAAVAMLAGGCGGTELPSEPAPTAATAAARVYLDSAITVMENVAFYRRRVDWTAVRAAARATAANATTPAATYPAIRNALTTLNDHHSFLQLPVSAASVSATRVAPLADSLDGQIVGGRFGYLHVPTFGLPLGTPDAATRSSQMADTLQALVRVVDAQNPCGWVIDLRHNRGGNMWPMLAGVGPVIGDGPYGAFVDADGQGPKWDYRNGAAGTISASGVSVVAAITSRAAYTIRRPNPPVAVLTDSLTASSGEAITVAFRGRPATRSFGGATFGVPTANSGYRLPDGAYLLMMVAVDADRTGRQYDSRISPDVEIPQTGKPATDDATVVAATSWLATQAACAAP